MTDQSKVSSTLQQQITLRKLQLADPTAERLEQMHEQGMDTTNIAIQKVFVHLNQQLTPKQISELESIGITVYPDSWMPPVGSHATGFILADVPVTALESLTAKGYVVSLETAERKLEPLPES